MSNPVVTIHNQLSSAVAAYDSFNNEDQAQSLANYFGTLTPVGGPIAAGDTVAITPIHGPISVYIIYDAQNNPVKRVSTLGHAPVTFQVTTADTDVIALTTKFVQLLTTSPHDPLVVSFQALIKDGKAKASQLDAFFQNSADYKACTNVSYLLVMTTLARTPQSQGKTPPDATYSLRSLLGYLGVEWPSILPDITVSHFSCVNKNDALDLSCDINIHDITFAEGVLTELLTFLPDTTVRAKIVFNYKPDLSFLSTTLEVDFAAIHIPVGGGKTITLTKPTAILSITPLFKFVVFELKATIPFSLFNSPTFNANVAMTIDNVEAEIGVVLDGNGNTLLTPPVMKGVHFDSIGVGMGVIFEPPAYALGVQGTFHIGAAGAVTLDDDTFVVVCSLEGDVPTPLYISFYVPKLDLEEIITLFTNTQYNIGFPVSVTDLSFKWAANPMEPITLPDGSLAAMAYGFSGNVELLGLGLYGDVEIDMNNGLTGTLTMSPFALGPLSLTGNGQGVTIKVDDKGNPIKNNFIPKTAAEKLAVEQAKTQQLIAPGGPSMTISTASSPYFTLGADLQFLGLRESINAAIAHDGMSFDLTFPTLQMHCQLQDYQNFSGSFAYGPDFTISLPPIAGFSIGSIHFQATINATLSVTVANAVVHLSVGGGFSLFGLSPTIGPFEISVNISGIEEVFDAIKNWIINNVSALFGSLYGDAKAWINAINNAVIQPLENDAKYLAQGLATAYNQTIDEAGALLKTTAYGINEVGQALATTYNATADAVASALAAAGYSLDEVAGALKTIGYGLQDVTNAIGNAFGAAPSVINDALQQAGYAVNDIEDAFNSIGGPFASFASSTWGTISHSLNPSNW